MITAFHTSFFAERSVEVVVEVVVFVFVVVMLIIIVDFALAVVFRFLFVVRVPLNNLLFLLADLDLDLGIRMQCFCCRVGSEKLAPWAHHRSAASHVWVMSAWYGRFSFMLAEASVFSLVKLVFSLYCRLSFSLLLSDWHSNFSKE